MKVVVVNKVPFSSQTFDNVVSITYSNGNVVINNGTNHTFRFDDVKIMIV